MEYDKLSNTYAKLLLTEVLPAMRKEYNITDGPDGHAIGSTCTFEVAWERPGVFRKVMSYVGSLTNIRGGHNYAALTRKT